MAYLMSLPHLHTLYIHFSIVIDCTFVYPIYNYVVVFCRTALLYLGQVAVVNDNFYYTGLPG
jgi:hypothetical protein